VVGIQVTTANWANLERRAHWVAAIGMVLDRPGLGIGAGGFNDQFRAYTPDWHFRISQGHAHNAYLQVAAEAGVFALVSYLAFLGSVVANLVFRVRASDRSMIPLGVLAGTIGMATHQLFDYLNVLSLGLLFAAAWAFALAPSEQDSKNCERSCAN
jgi:O-antigen ligase